MDNEGSRNVIRSERSAGKCGHGKDEKHFLSMVGGGILEESVCKRAENAGEEDKEGE